MNLVANTNSSFRIFENTSMNSFVQALIDISHKYPGVRVEELLSGRKAIKSFLNDRLALIDKDLLDICTENKDCLSFTADIWTDAVNKNSYLKISMFFTDHI